MKRVKAMNGYTIYEYTNRDAKGGKTPGEFAVFFSSDIRDYGAAYSYPEFDNLGSLAEAVENIADDYTGRALEGFAAARGLSVTVYEDETTRAGLAWVEGEEIRLPEVLPTISARDLEKLAAADVVEYRAAHVRFKSWFAQFDAARRETTTPAEAVALLVSRLGWEDMRRAVASVVSSVGTWDARIDSRRRDWAAHVAGSLDRSACDKVGTYSETHPAHIDQIAAEAMRTPEPAPTPEEPETVAPSVELPEFVTSAPDFPRWRDAVAPFSPATVREFSERFGVYISTDNGKTAIPSFSTLAGSVAHEFDGSAAAAGVEARLHHKMRYSEYCEAHGITIDEMTELDYEQAYRDEWDA